MLQEERSGGKPRLMRSNELPSWIVKDDAEVYITDFLFVF